MNSRAKVYQLAYERARMTTHEHDDAVSILKGDMVASITGKRGLLASATQVVVDDFPYKRLHGDMLADITRRFRALIAWRPHFIERPYSIKNAPRFRADDLRLHSAAGECKPIIMAFSADDYEELNLITDYFIEHLRIRARRSDDPDGESIYEYWSRAKDEIMRMSRDLKIDPREVIYASKMEVGTFRPAVATGLIWFLRAHFDGPFDYVLDPCGGWGDRLVGAMAAGARGYVSADPNPALHDAYERIITWAQGIADIPTALAHFTAPFEDLATKELLDELANARRTPVVDAADGFDLALTSPPYFDLEIYVPVDRTGEQSITRYTTFDEWYRRFLITSLAKAATCLRVGGILAVVISQLPRAHGHPEFLERMLKDVVRVAARATTGERVARMRYIGPLAFAKRTEDSRTTTSPQPIWLWIREA